MQFEQGHPGISPSAKWQQEGDDKHKENINKAAFWILDDLPALAGGYFSFLQ